MTFDESLRIIHESEAVEEKRPGRYMRWLASSSVLGSEMLSSCLIRVLPGETVLPAHAHTQGEELIYIISGTGSVLVDGKVGAVKNGSTVLFPRKAVHMLRNDGTDEMKVICFFAPPAHPDNYEYHEDVHFP